MVCFVFQAEDGIRDLVRSRGLVDVDKSQVLATTTALLLLMQRGKLTLDDRIDRILIALQGLSLIHI